MARIFISHSSNDNAVAAGVVSWLLDKGWKKSDFFLDFDRTEGIIAGDKWSPTLDSALKLCHGLLAITSKSWVASDQCKREWWVAQADGKALFVAAADNLPRANLASDMQAVQGLSLAIGSDLQQVQIHLEFVERVHSRVVNLNLDALERLHHALEKNLRELRHVWPPENEPDRAPYPGLAAFDEIDAPVYFGRDADIQRAVERVRKSFAPGTLNLVIILGASGAGKSSLLRAGLLPQLRVELAHPLVLPVVRPLDAAISGREGLAASLETAAKSVGIAQVLNRGDLYRRLTEAPTNIDDILSSIVAARPLGADEAHEPLQIVLAIDQCEELFSSYDSGEAKTLVDVLAYLLTVENDAATISDNAFLTRAYTVSIVVTIRSDNFTLLQLHPSFSDFCARAQNVALSPLSDRRYRDVIVGPAKRQSECVQQFELDDALVEQLLSENVGADALPLLAFTLRDLYDAYKEKLLVTVADYAGADANQSGLRRTFERAASTALPGVSGDKLKHLLRAVFIPRLVSVDIATRSAKRRIARMDEFVAESALIDVVKKLIEARLLRVAEPDSNEALQCDIVEVAHEALLRQYPPLKALIDEETANLVERETLVAEAEEWGRTGKGVNSPWLLRHGDRLQTAKLLLNREDYRSAFSDLHREYVKACDTKEVDAIERENKVLREKRRALRRLGVVVATAACLVVLGIFVTLTLQYSASRERSLVLADASIRAIQVGDDFSALRLAILATEDTVLAPRNIAADDALRNAAIAARAISTLVSETNIRGFTFSPGGNRIVIVNDDDSAHLWDISTRQKVGSPFEHSAEMDRLSFSKDGTRLLCFQKRKVMSRIGRSLPLFVRAAGSVELLNGETTEKVVPTLTPSGDIQEASFSPDGIRLMTASLSGLVTFWEKSTGTELTLPRIQIKGPLRSARFDPSGDTVITVDGSGSVQTWNSHTGAKEGKPLPTFADEATFVADGTRIVTTVRFPRPKYIYWNRDSHAEITVPWRRSEDETADGKLLVALDESGGAQVWNSKLGTKVGPSMRTEYPIQSAKFSSAGDRIVTISSDGGAEIWNTSTSERIGRPLLAGKSVRSAIFGLAAGKSVLATNGGDDQLHIWQYEPIKGVGRNLGRSTSSVRSILTADGTKILLRVTDKHAQLLDLTLAESTGEPPSRTIYDAMSSEGAVLSPDGQFFTANDKKGLTLIRSTTTGGIVATLPRTRYIRTMFSSDSKSILRIGDGNVQIFWSASGENIGLNFDMREPVSVSHWAWDGRRVLAVARGRRVEIWDTGTGKKINTQFEHTDEVTYMELSRDGKKILTVLADNSIRIRTVEPNGRPDVALHARSKIVAANFNVNGTQVVASYREHSTRVWDSGNGAERCLLGPREQGGKEAHFSADGTRVVTVSSDNVVQVWHLKTCTKAGPPLQHPNPVLFAEFIAAGNKILTVDDGNTLRSFDVSWTAQAPTIEELRSALCARIDARSRTLLSSDESFSPATRDRSEGDVCVGTPWFKDFRRTFSIKSLFK